MDAKTTRALEEALLEARKLEKLAAEGVERFESAAGPARVIVDRLVRAKLGLSVRDFSGRAAEGVALLEDLQEGRRSPAEIEGRLHSYRLMVGKVARAARTMARQAGAEKDAVDRVKRDVEGVRRLYDSLGRVLGAADGD